MVTTQEIIERTLYASLMRITLGLNKTVNPELYLPVSSQNSELYKAAVEAIGPDFIYIFGVGNNQVRGVKEVPRITIELNAYYPGNIGTEAFMIGEELVDNEYVAYNFPFETKHVQFDIHLVANTAEQLRLLHRIMYTALPARGYIRPFLEDTLAKYLETPRKLKSGNVYLEVSNYYDHNDQEHGLLEKVYSYTCYDSYIEETENTDLGPIAPIKDISAIIALTSPNSDVSSKDSSIRLQVPTE